MRLRRLSRILMLVEWLISIDICQMNSRRGGRILHSYVSPDTSEVLLLVVVLDHLHSSSIWRGCLSKLTIFTEHLSTILSSQFNSRRNTRLPFVYVSRITSTRSVAVIVSGYLLGWTI